MKGGRKISRKEVKLLKLTDNIENESRRRLNSLDTKFRVIIMIYLNINCYRNNQYD